MAAKRKVLQHTSHTNTCMANPSTLWHARELLIHRCPSFPHFQNCKSCSRSRFLAPGRRTCQECANAEVEASRRQASHKRTAREGLQSSTREPSLLQIKRGRSDQPPAAAAAATASQSAFLTVDARSDTRCMPRFSLTAPSVSLPHRQLLHSAAEPIHLPSRLQLLPSPSTLSNSRYSTRCNNTQRGVYLSYSFIVCSDVSCQLESSVTFQFLSSRRRQLP